MLVRREAVQEGYVRNANVCGMRPLFAACYILCPKEVRRLLAEGEDPFTVCLPHAPAQTNATWAVLLGMTDRAEGEAPCKHKCKGEGLEILEVLARQGVPIGAHPDRRFDKAWLRREAACALRRGYTLAADGLRRLAER